MFTVNIGYGNQIAKDKILAIIKPEASPIRRMIQDFRDMNKLVDATCGRRTKAVIVCENYLVLSALQVKTLSERISQSKNCI